MPRLSEEEREEITSALYGAKEYLIRAQEVAVEKGVTGVAKKIETIFQKTDRLYRDLTG